MTNEIVVALISAGGSVLVAVTALILNYRGFASIDARMNLMQSDMRDLNKTMMAIESAVALLRTFPRGGESLHWRRRGKNR